MEIKWLQMIYLIAIFLYRTLPFGDFLQQAVNAALRKKNVLLKTYEIYCSILHLAHVLGNILSNFPKGTVNLLKAIFHCHQLRACFV